MKTISVSLSTWRELNNLRGELNATHDEVIQELLRSYRIRRIGNKISRVKKENLELFVKRMIKEFDLNI